MFGQAQAKAQEQAQVRRTGIEPKTWSDEHERCTAEDALASLKQASLGTRLYARRDVSEYWDEINVYTEEDVIEDYLERYGIERTHDSSEFMRDLDAYLNSTLTSLEILAQMEAGGMRGIFEFYMLDDVYLEHEVAERGHILGGFVPLRYMLQRNGLIPQYRGKNDLRTEKNRAEMGTV